jgi:nitrogen-specific signal transduction histidine kinase
VFYIYILLSEAPPRLEKKDSSAEEFGVDAFELAMDIGNHLLIYKSARQLSRFYTDTLSSFKQAIAILDKALDILDDDAEAEHKAELLRLLGLNCDYNGELMRSKTAYDESIRLLQSSFDLTRDGRLTLARSQFNLSIIYGRLELPGMADVCLRSAYEQYKELDEKNGIARCYISFGVNLEETGGDVNEAFDYYKKAAALSREIKDDVSLCVALGNMAVKQAEKGEFDNALLHAFEALEKATLSANKRFQLSLCRQIGRCYHLKKDYTNGQHWFVEGEKIFKELELNIDYYNLYGYWSDMLYDAGNYKDAFEKMKKAEKHKEEMHNFHKNAAVSDAMLRFQIEEGKKEQDILKRKAAEVEQYARKLEASHFELKQFTHAASHDMKEPLRMISNYSQLLEKSMAGKLGKEQQEYLTYLNEGAKRLMSVLNNLIQWSNINPTLNMEKVDMEQLLIGVEEELHINTGELNVDVKYSAMPVIQTGLLAMKHIFTNLIDNSVKYNLNAVPKVEVSYFEQGNLHRFTVDDNGIGIQEEYRQKVFIIFQRLHARDEFGGAGIGLTICKKIIDNLNGKIWIEDSPLGGTRICFTIPK